MNILLVNGGQKFGHSEGRLNRTLHDKACEVLSALGHTIKETHISEGWDNAAEVSKLLWADTVIYQMPGWWINIPWTVKKYMDEVYTEGHLKLYTSDGRHSNDPSHNYGTGGLMQGHKYMLSVTWNAPLAAFDEENEFFDGKGVDSVYSNFHKAQKFLGYDDALPTFSAHDVIKNPEFEEYMTGYEAHLKKLFG